MEGTQGKLQLLQILWTQGSPFLVECRKCPHVSTQLGTPDDSNENKETNEVSIDVLVTNVTVKDWTTIMGEKNIIRLMSCVTKQTTRLPLCATKQVL